MKKEFKNSISTFNKFLIVVLVVVIGLIILNFINGKTITGRAVTNLNCNALEQTYYFGGVAIAVNNLGTEDSGKQTCLNWCNSKTEGKSCWWYARDGGCVVGSNERIPYPNSGDPNIPYSYAGNCIINETTQPPIATVICSSNSQCGTNYDPTPDKYTCSGNYLYNDMINFTCVNPGTTTSYCTNSTTNTLVKACASNEVCSTTSGCVSNPIINGTCGSSNGQTFTTSPTTNLCSQGTPSTVTIGNNTYTWTCQGSNGGTTASCSAIRSSSTTLKCTPFTQYRWWDTSNYNNQFLGSYSSGTGETGKQKCLTWCNSLGKVGICTWYSTTGACSLHTGNMISKSSAYMFASSCAIQ